MDQRNLKKARKDAETSEPSSKINPSEALEPEKKKAKIVKGQKSTKPVKATGTPKSQLQNAAMKEAKDTPKSDNDLSSKTKEASGSGTLLDLGKTEDEVVNVHDSEMSTNSQIISKEKSQIDEKHQEKLGEALEPEKKKVKILKRKKPPQTVKATATPKSKLQNAAIIEAKGTPKSDNDMSFQTNEASGTLPDLEKTEDEVVNARDTEKITNSPITNKEESQIDEKHRDKLGEVKEPGKKKVKIVKVKKSIKTVKATGTPKSQLQNPVMREAKDTTKSDNDMSSNSKEASGTLLDLGKTEDEVVNAHDSDSQITNTEKSHNEEKHQVKLGEALEPNKKKVKKVGKKSVKIVKATSTPKSKLQNAAISEGKGTPKSENNMSSKTKEASGALQDQEKIKNEVLNARDKGKSTNSKVIKKEKSQIDDKHQEKLGGLIFMCNSKTKSDCFKYKVMGLPAGHQELVRSIKPGRKLFLYDVGQKLLYGIYSASAAGGMKLEPNAFDGSYPAQVRFKVHKECLPLPESVFKKAIEENYIEKKRWFKTELTVQQVQKLTKLFLASKTNIPTQNTPQQKPLGESAIKSQSEKVHKDLPARDRKSVDESRSRYYGMPQIYQRGQVYSGHQETVPSLKLPRDPLFLSEKEYRAFGLVREPIQTPEAPAPPQVYSAGFSVDPNLTGRDHPHQNQYDPASSNLYPVPPMRATAATSTYPYEVSMFPDQMDYHERGSERRLLASQAPRQATSAAATLSYGYPGRAEIEYSRDGEIPSSRYARSELSGYEGGRTRTGETERLNPTYAFGAATDYERRQPQLVSRPQLEALPVSSRYSFAGPSLYYS